VAEKTGTAGALKKVSLRSKKNREKQKFRTKLPQQAGSDNELNNDDDQKSQNDFESTADDSVQPYGKNLFKSMDRQKKPGSFKLKKSTS
jgi:hypothetical protein